MKMMKFLKTIADSISSKDFYLGIIRKEKNMGYGFVFKLQIVAALFLTILLSINISTVLPYLDKMARDILPEGAEIIIKEGILETNTNPITIAFPPNTSEFFNLEKNKTSTSTFNQKTELAGSDGTDLIESKSSGNDMPRISDVKNVIVLDITASTTPEDLIEKNTLILVTSEGVIVRNDTGRFSISYFNDVKNLNISIDEEWLISKVNWTKDFAKFIPFIAFVFLLLSLFVGSLLAALLYGFGTWLIFKFLKKPQPFLTAYSIGLYSRTFATVLGLLTFIIPVIGKNWIIVPLELFFIYYMIKDVRKSHVKNIKKE